MTAEMRPPDATVRPEYAAFFGKWGGYWNGELASNLIVERVLPSGQARGIYAWGTTKYVEGPGASRFRAQIDEDGVLSWGGRIRFEFKLLDDGRLRVERYVDGAQRGLVTMVKMM